MANDSHGPDQWLWFVKDRNDVRLFQLYGPDEAFALREAIRLSGRSPDEVTVENSGKKKPCCDSCGGS